MNAHIFPGPAIVTALKSAASAAISDYNTKVHTVVTTGTPADEDESEDDLPEIERHSSNGSLSPGHGPYSRDVRKASVISISTTITNKSEPISPQPTPYIDLGDDAVGTAADVFDKLGHPPYLRALLLLAEMSSEGNLLTGPYTEQCVSIAREHREFVIGFIAQRSLNTEPDDNFITMTPGVSLPPPGQQAVTGDGLGQQYNTPESVIFDKGCDVVIVGRGIYKSEDRRMEAERYRVAAWKAYEKRIGKS